MADNHTTDACAAETGTAGDSDAPVKPTGGRPGSAQPPRHLTALTTPQPTMSGSEAKPLSTRPGGATWALPAAATIAAVARANTAGELGALGVDGALTRTLTTSDVLVMVSELATNAYQHTAACQDGQMHPAAGAELWMYRQVTSRGHRELMIAVFDRSSELPRSTHQAAGWEAEHGRGLMLVEAMAQGRCGSHRTRSRLTNLPGKVTWFAVPLPDAKPDHAAVWERDAVAAGKVLETLLASRGFDSLFLHSHPGSNLAVLSVATGLTVWCQDDHFRWGTRRRTPIANVTAVAEEIVHLHEIATRPGGRPA